MPCLIRPGPPRRSGWLFSDLAGLPGTWPARRGSPLVGCRSAWLAGVFEFQPARCRPRRGGPARAGSARALVSRPFAEFQPDAGRAPASPLPARSALRRITASLPRTFRRSRRGARVHGTEGLLAGLHDDRVGEHEREHVAGHLDGRLAAAGLLRLLVACARDLRRAQFARSVRRRSRRATPGPRRRPSSRRSGRRAAGGASRREPAPPAGPPASAPLRRPGCRARRAPPPAPRGGRGRCRRLPAAQPLPEPAQHGVGLLGPFGRLAGVGGGHGGEHGRADISQVARGCA